MALPMTCTILEEIFKIHLNCTGTNCLKNIEAQINRTVTQIDGSAYALQGKKSICLANCKVKQCLI